MKIKMYKCENCGNINSHKNSYNDKYCYDCIDIETGELKENNLCINTKNTNVSDVGHT
jgi:hypothetical protein